MKTSEARRQGWGIFPETQGRTKDIGAAKADLSSGKTLEAAQKVVEHGTPELVAAMYAGTVSIRAAAAIAMLPSEEQRHPGSGIRRAKTDKS